MPPRSRRTTENDSAILLGKVLEGIDQLREDFKEEKAAAAISRAAIHRRLDDHSREIGEVRTDNKIIGQTISQTREHVKNLDPTIEQWKRMIFLGRGVFFLLALGGLSLGAAVVWLGESLINLIRHWLRIT